LTTFLMWGAGVRQLEVPELTPAWQVQVPDSLSVLPAVRAVRAIYRYSVVPGGVFTPNEFAAAVRRDPVVAAHYAGVDPQLLRASITTEPMWAYVSYRRGDQILWTSRKLHIPAGETVLTDGQTTIRARCANAISVQALTPVAVDEPPPLEFDLTEPPVVLAALPPAGDPDDPGEPPPPPPPPPTPTPEPPIPPGPPPITPVPEPGTLVLVGLGAAVGLARYVRRRQQSRD
jgi:hypothetical protein